MRRWSRFALAIFIVMAFIFILPCSSCMIKDSEGHVISDHIHSYMKEWSVSQTEHWHDAACGHKLTSDRGKHVFSGDGFACSACGYVGADDLPFGGENPNWGANMPQPSCIDEKNGNGENVAGCECSRGIGLRLKSGKTVQIISLLDKMSASWIFEAVNADGDGMEVDSNGVKISPLVTDTVGNYTTEVSLGELTGEVKYEILPVPEIVSSFSVSPTEIVRETDGDFLTFVQSDFNISASVIVEHTVKVLFESDEFEKFIFSSEGGEYAFRCPSDGVERKFFIVARYAFITEDEDYEQVLRTKISVTVKRKQAQSDRLKKGDFGIEGTAFGDSLSDRLTESVTVGNENVEIVFAPDEYGNFAVGCCSDGLYISLESEAESLPYSGLSIRLYKRATVELTLYAVDGEGGLLMVDGRQYSENVNSERATLMFELPAGDAHVFTFVPGSNSKIVICAISVFFSD